MAWIKVVERKGQSVLISSYFYKGIQTKYFKKSLGLNVGLNKYLIIDYVNYYDDIETDKFKREISKILEDTDFEFLKKFFDIFYLKAEELIKFSRKIKESNKDYLAKNKLVLFKKFSELCLEYGPSMYFPILVEEVVEDKIRKIIDKYIKKEKSKYFELFTSSPKPTEWTKELLGIYNIAKKLKRGKSSEEVNKDIKAHLERYGWLSYTKFAGELWNEKLIMKRIQELKNKDIELEIKTLENKYKNNVNGARNAIKEYNVSANDANIIWLAKELAYFRTYRIDAYTKAGFNAIPLFEVISGEFEISREDFVFLTYREIIECLETNKHPSKDIIKKRKLLKWQLKFDNGAMEFKYNNFEKVGNCVGGKISEIKGNAAFSGKVRGIVSIVRGVLEFNKMKKGNILVTSMTTPDFVPLMEKAKAIVTDEGGITCHAAIVSRELKIPCIVGTKIATKIFKDGDLVEVDANKGIVKVLKHEIRN